MSQSFYIHSDAGESCFLARRLLTEGHRVKIFIKAPRSRQVGLGWAPRVNVFAPARSDVVIFDMVGAGAEADRLRRRGYKVIGGSQFADLHEINRAQGLSLMTHVGISTPQTWSFMDVKEAKKLLMEQEDTKWFFKPEGDADAHLTYGSIGREDMLDWLDYAKVTKGFVLQKKAEGSELSLEGWFDGSRWVLPFNSTVEDKKFMAGNAGPNIGCAGNVVWAYRESRPTLASKTVVRLQNILAEARYCGPVDLNMIIDAKGEPQGLEWTMRFGYDALAALSMLNVGDLGEQLGAFAEGSLHEFEIAADEMAMTMRVTMPPYPSLQHAMDVYELRVDPSIMNSQKDMFPQDIKLMGGRPVMAGSDASVVVVGQRGKDPMTMRSKILKRVHRLAIKDAQYKADLCDRYYSVVADLSKHNYDTFAGLSFSSEAMESLT